MSRVNFPPKLLLPDEEYTNRANKSSHLYKSIVFAENQLIRIFCCFFRSVEADARLLGILNEQYDDRDTLISEISREVRHLVVCFQRVRLVLFS